MAENTEKTYSIMEVNRQLKVTVPIVQAQAVGLKAGDKIKRVEDRGELVMKKA
jgi:bifunctional DNA-binding transcriptional regulator/antitoxin component of YhaV-PrlF toxin-antitoxin module